MIWISSGLVSFKSISDRVRVLWGRAAAPGRMHVQPVPPPALRKSPQKFSLIDFAWSRVYVTRFERRVCLDFCICVRAEISVRAKKSKRERNFAPPEVSLCHFRQEFCLSTKAESISKIPLMGHTSRRLLFSCVFGLCTWPTFKSPHERLIYERCRM